MRRRRTDFTPAFEWISENVVDRGLRRLLHDLDTMGWGDDPGIPVLWIDVSGCAGSAEVPFGEVVKVRIRR